MPICLFTLCKITNPDDNFKLYVKRSAELADKYGARYIVRGQPQTGADSPFAGQSLVGLQFDSEETFKAYAVEYAQLIPLRDGSGEYQSAVYTAA
jgi:uncharacterized protein (DUF1330 family)